MKRIALTGQGCELNQERVMFVAVVATRGIEGDQTAQKENPKGQES
jgi:hypothetical protein